MRMCDSLGKSVVSRTPASVEKCCVVVVDGSNGRIVVPRDGDDNAVVVAAAVAADCVKLMTSAPLRENGVIGAVSTAPPPRLVDVVEVARVLFPVVAGKRSAFNVGVVIVFQLDVA